VQVSFRLALPREEASVPLTRRLIAQALEVVGVEPETISDVEIAVSEACANVLRHAKSGDAYEVRAGFDDTRAFLEIIDEGGGFQISPDGQPIAAPDAESGRGVTLMKALMDTVRFQSRHGDRNSVILEKSLRFVPSAPIKRLGRPAQIDPV
jgi:serine/threonine-protein kinase RsbW